MLQRVSGRQIRRGLILLLCGVWLAACAAPGPFPPVTKSDPPASTRQQESPRSVPPSPRPQPAEAPATIARVTPTPAASNLIARANSALALQNLDEAELWLERAQRMSPQAGEVYLSLARLRARQGDWLAAEQFCQRALALAGNDSRFRAEAERLLSEVQRRRV